MIKRLTIGIAGIGTVGGGVLELLEKNKEIILKRTGHEIFIKSVCVRDINKKRDFLPQHTIVTTNPLTIACDPEIDVFVELMGGIDQAKTAITQALQKGKSIVTANKALLAEEGNSLFKLAAEKKLHLLFEAAVAGGIPIIQTLKESLAGNDIYGFLGILNGTGNYILSEMTSNGLDFNTALKQAQELGIAEAEPSLDIDGFDAAHKLNLLIRLAWGVEYPYKLLSIQGIRNMNKMDIDFAREFGYRLKLLGQARNIENKIEAGVFPALVNQKLLLAKVGGAYNAVRVEGNGVGPLFLHGLGAGALPTASAVLADILSIAKGTEANNFGYNLQNLSLAEIIPPEKSVNAYYLRFMVKDDAGVLRDLAGALAEEHISIAQVIQKSLVGNAVPLVFITHKAPYEAIQNAMASMKNSLLENPICYRIFD